MKKIILFAIIIFANTAYAQDSIDDTTKINYYGVVPLMPDATQIVKETPTKLLKIKYTTINPSETLKIAENNSYTTKINYDKILPAPSIKKED